MGIVVNDSQNLFMLQTRSNSYAFGIDNQGLVRHLYWGIIPFLLEITKKPLFARDSGLYGQFKVRLIQMTALIFR